MKLTEIYKQIIAESDNSKKTVPSELNVGWKNITPLKTKVIQNKILKLSDLDGYHSSYLKAAKASLKNNIGYIVLANKKIIYPNQYVLFADDSILIYVYALNLNEVYFTAFKLVV